MNVEISAFWNDFALKRPPVITLPIRDADFADLVQNVIQPAIKAYLAQHAQQQQTLEFEQTAALLSRLMARRKSSFRRQPGFHTICKLNAALGRFLRVDLPRELKRFSGSLPDVACVGMEVPSRSCLEYLLARLLAVYHLHVRVRSLCTQAAVFFGRLVRNNFFMDISVLLLSVFAKLYSFSARLGNDCVDLYGTLRAHSDRFPCTENFQPASEELPAQLERFVQPAPVQSASEASATAAPSMESSLVLATAPPRKTTSIIARKRPLDIGVPVERVQPAAAGSQQAPAKKRPKSSFVLQQLKHADDVPAFFKAETKARQKSLETCATRNVRPHEWLGLQHMFQRKVDALEPTKALSIVCQFLSSKM